jgi:hypothetical protein
VAFVGRGAAAAKLVIPTDDDGAMPGKSWHDSYFPATFCWIIFAISK